jgi:hypothetical protein
VGAMPLSGAALARGTMLLLRIATVEIASLCNLPSVMHI